MKTLMKTIFPSIIILGIFLFSGVYIRAEAEDNLKVYTDGYAVLSSNSFVFSGSYSGNYSKEGLTTYFEYKKGDSNFNNSSERTIEIKREKGEEFGVFYTSPELKLFSKYYFRAVGFLNDNPEKRFYGKTLEMTTGPNFLGIIPFFYNGTNILPFNPSNFPNLSSDQNDKGQQGDYNNDSSGNDNSSSDNNSSGNGDTDDSPNQRNGDESGYSSTDISGIASGLVKCGTERYSEGEELDERGRDLVGQIKNPCGFNNALDMINSVIEFIFTNIVLPLAAIMFAYAGFELVTSGGSTEKKAKAKSIFTSVAIGLVVAAAAFTIVKTLLIIMGYQTGGGWYWFGF